MTKLVKSCCFEQIFVRIVVENCFLSKFKPGGSIRRIGSQMKFLGSSSCLRFKCRSTATRKIRRIFHFLLKLIFDSNLTLGASKFNFELLRTTKIVSWCTMRSAGSISTSRKRTAPSLLPCCTKSPRKGLKKIDVLRFVMKFHNRNSCCSLFKSQL